MKDPFVESRICVAMETHIRLTRRNLATGLLLVRSAYYERLETFYQKLFDRGDEVRRASIRSRKKL